MKAMIFAAGLGTRLKPFTNQHPKALAPFKGKTLLEHNVRYLQKFGVTDVVVNVHHFAEQIVEAVHKNNGFGSRISISDESHDVLETGGGLKKAASLLIDKKEPILLMNVDVVTNINLKDLMAFHQKHKPLASLAVMNRPSSRYLVFDENQQLVGWKNTANGEEKIARPFSENIRNLAFSGIQIIDSRFLDLADFDGKFSIIDVYLKRAQTENILAFDHSGDLFLDVGKPESLIKAEGLF